MQRRTTEELRCEFLGCRKGATTEMKSRQTGKTEWYCEEHAQWKLRHNWILVKPEFKIKIEVFK